MRYSKAFIPTLKEVPKDATMPSHVLLLRGGYARAVGAGIYELLPLGLRVLHKIAGIIRDEMDAAGAQEVLMPALLPAEYFKESGRWDSFGETLLRLKDRKLADYHLGPTHEEIITDMVRRDVGSYRQLPLNLYQIQTKFRDEARPRAGLLRCREFTMKDAYSFDVDEAGALRSYESMRVAYCKIFDRIGLQYRMVQADSGAMGGSTSAEFQVLASSGEDAIVACTQCDYAANVEVAVTKAIDAAQTSAADTPAMEKVATPGKRSIQDVVAFLGNGLTAARMFKSLIYTAGTRSVMVVVRGDHEVNEIKLAKQLGVSEVHLAPDNEVFRVTRAPVGFAGPVGFVGEVIADNAVASIVDGVTGANEKDLHFTHVRFGRDFNAPLADVRNVTDGDTCASCGGALKSYRGIEAGHIFVLGTHYTEKLKATYATENRETKTIVMGCYGIGVSRLIAATIEQNHDEQGIVWPMSVAPYQVMITPLSTKPGAVIEAAEALYAELTSLGIEVLFDDRDERPGVKFKDADLLGIPLRLTIGDKSLAAGSVELKLRNQKDVELVPREGCVTVVRDLIDRLKTGTK